MPEEVLDQIAEMDAGDSAGENTGVEEINDSDVSEQPEAEEEQPAEEVAEADDQPDSDEARLAKQFELDPNDPKDAKRLKQLLAMQKRITDKDQHIAKLESGKDEAAEALADLDDLFKEDEPEPAKPAPVAKPPIEQQPNGQQQQQQTGRQNPNEILAGFRQSEMAEWGRINADIEAGRQPNYERLNELEARKWEVYAGALLPPVIVPLQQKIAEFEQRIAELAPQVTETVADRRWNSAVDEVQGAILNSKAGELFREMHKSDGGEPIKLNGKVVESTPWARIIAANPEIMKIRETDADPVKADKLTIRARYQAALRIFATQRQKPAEAKKLVATGQQIEKQKVAEKARQAVNAGGRTSRSSGPAGRPPIGTISFADL